MQLESINSDHLHSIPLPYHQHLATLLDYTQTPKQSLLATTDIDVLLYEKTETIFVKSLTGQILTININLSATVLSLKWMINIKAGFHLTNSA